MKRVAIFAHYDSEEQIQSYVVYYLQELKKSCDKIIFVSDGNLSEDKIASLDGIVDFSVVGRHQEYDFGSYKRGFHKAKELGFIEEADELLLANDSCIGPIFSIERLFDSMTEDSCDFWGITINNSGAFHHANMSRFDMTKYPHVQSYFVLLKRQVFTSKVFEEFIASVRQEKQKDDVIVKYELGLSQVLSGAGFKMNAVGYGNLHLFGNLSNDSHRMPFIKTSHFKNIGNTILYRWWKKTNKKYIECPFSIIDRYAIKQPKKLSFRKLRRETIRVHITKGEVYFMGRLYKL